MSAAKLQLLRHAMERYAPLSQSTWKQVQQSCSERKLAKGEILVQIGAPSQHLYFVCQGLLRSYTLSEDGKEYNKKFFPENTFPGSIRALLTGGPSDFALQALEASVVLAIDHPAYRRLLEKAEDLKWYHIQYLETNWVLDKEPIEVGLALSDSSARYQAFVEKHASILHRIPLHHIASAIGVTPTQLSRIRKL
ncbi:cyclic nucleotide-binding domain-containing protein [Pelagicoccus sp. NFK12]|uniref:Cyclic nucleotide-binding domain-containing protein n=1 Tax=Pelagicoccus enzymogenes TaxID=2773457 RepID=A0A927F870_9BACT|nr:cyclic nucleotide-binding domain-containing protein [Pelagicoccus enzymogenes]MBD5778955.1 cyclic nucleotide-binding domain-containing protein [Pelagicoccus enzymogenes]MDQ8197301.1 cyclic nucleotide-binding domain-containing protein [Pelagicoccus enzymogenes]